MADYYKPPSFDDQAETISLIDSRVATILQSQSVLGQFVPRSIPHDSVIRPLVDDLPVAPGDGDEVRYIADSDNGIIWHLRYRANAPSNYRWEFVGGSCLYDNTAASESRSTNSYGDLSTVGPTVSIPLAGEYFVDHGAEIQIGSNALTHGSMSYSVVGTSASDTWSANVVGGTALHRSQVMRRYLHGISTPGDLVGKYSSPTSNGVTFSYRWISAIPVRVGRT